MLAARACAGGKGLMAVGGGEALEQLGEARGQVTGSPSAVSDGHGTIPQRVFSPARAATRRAFEVLWEMESLSLAGL
jgi:hypothetical protein